MAVYPGQPGWAGTRTLRNINPLNIKHYHPYSPQISHKHTQPSLAGLPVYLQDTKKKAEKQLKETW